MSEEKSNYWTVGAYCNEQETLEHAKSRAEREAENTGKAVYLYKIVGVVQVFKQAAWSMVDELPTPPAPVADEPFGVGDVVEAISYIQDKYYKASVIDGSQFHVEKPLALSFLEGPSKGTIIFRNYSEVRRPAAAPAAAFEFGQAVSIVGPNVGGGDYSPCSGVVVRVRGKFQCDVWIDRECDWHTYDNAMLKHI